MRMKNKQKTSFYLAFFFPIWELKQKIGKLKDTSDP